MRMFLSIAVTKLLIFAGKLLGKKSSSTPGAIALKICPDVLKKLSSQVRCGIIAVCGTNGKTTTNNLIYSALTENGKKVVCNNVGANMLPGIVTAFVNKSNLFGKLDADYASLEIDEISTIHVFKHINPKFMIITNLFRDQLDRYGEIEKTLSYLEKAISYTDDLTLVLNGDDPILSGFGKVTDKKCVYYGVGEDAKIAVDEIRDGRFCRFCGAELEYDFYHYSQLGKYNCPKCDFTRPEIDFEASKLDLDGHLNFTVDERRIEVNYRGFYNIYNILASYSVLKLSGEDLESFQQTLKNYKPQVGRMEEFKIGDKSIIFNLSKNPAGFNQAISTVVADRREKSVVVAVNDKAPDGIDISWLWDVDFERFNDANVKSCAVSGMRGNDIEVRLKYADVHNVVRFDNIEDAILESLKADVPVIYLLVNYTALFSTREILKKLGAEDGGVSDGK